MRSNETGDCREGKAQLAGMFWLESPHFQLENEISVQAHVIEEEIDVKGLPVHGHRHLTADEGEAAAQLQEEIAQMAQQPPFDLPLLGRGRHGVRKQILVGPLHAVTGTHRDRSGRKAAPFDHDTVPGRRAAT